MKILNIVIFIIVIFIVEAATEPKIHFNTPVIDLGRKAQSETVSHIFEFTNKGSSFLIIERLQACCGRNAELLTDPRIAPGETGKIRFSFNTRRRLGRVMEICEVYINESDRNKITLYVWVEVIKK